MLTRRSVPCLCAKKCRFCNVELIVSAIMIETRANTTMDNWTSLKQKSPSLFGVFFCVTYTKNKIIL